MKYTSVLALLLVAVGNAAELKSARIIGGDVTTIDRYPAMCAVLVSWDHSIFSQSCGGNILNSRSILSAAHCVVENASIFHRVRVGSTWGNSGGVVHAVSFAIIHPAYNVGSIFDADLTVFRLATPLSFNNNVQMSRIAGPNYNLQDNQVVWAAGWGIYEGGTPSEQLRHVQIWTINQAICRERYSPITITDNMLCSGVLDVGGRDQCNQDSGGPLYHNGVLVGVCSWGVTCPDTRFPGVNVRVSSFTPWIQANA